MGYLTTKVANPGLRSFSYTYDALNRLTNAAFTGGQSGDALNEQIAYDLMGNITQLTRGGTGGGALNYTAYTGNQLNTVTGYSPRTYTYDPNGNATTDGNTKAIQYNLLNLPQTVTQSGTTLATYTYDATGQKLRNSGSDGNWDYIGGIVYHNNTIAFIQTEDGRAANNSGSYNYEYNLQDHLGNNRVSIDANNNAVRLIQEDEYYSFGLRKPTGGYDLSNNNRYLYNGKELQEETGIYDFLARQYDPIIGRFTSVDPLAEKMRRFSPYNHAFNNPIRFVDPDGMAPTDIVFRGTDNKEARIKTAGEDKVYQVPFALKTNQTYDLGLSNIDPGRFAVGYTLSADAGYSAVLGYHAGGEISVVNFTDNKYSGYNYVYAGGHEAISAGAQADISARVGASVFVAYNNDTQPINPKSWAGAFFNTGVSADVKAIVGGGASISAFTGSDSFTDKGWKGISIGVSVGVGASINLGSANVTPSYSFLLNDVKPTSQRSFLDRATNFVAPIPSAIATGVVNSLQK